MFKFKPNEVQYVLVTDTDSEYYGKQFVVAHEDAQSFGFWPWSGLKNKVAVINANLPEDDFQVLSFDIKEVVEVTDCGCPVYEKDFAIVNFIHVHDGIKEQIKHIDNLYSITADLIGEVYGFKVKDLEIEEVETGYSTKKKSKTRKSKSKKSK